MSYAVKTCCWKRKTAFSGGGEGSLLVFYHYQASVSKDIDLPPPTIISLAIKNKEKFCSMLLLPQILNDDAKVESKAKLASGFNKNGNFLII